MAAGAEPALFVLYIWLHQVRVSMSSLNGTALAQRSKQCFQSRPRLLSSSIAKLTVDTDGSIMSPLRISCFNVRMLTLWTCCMQEQACHRRHLCLVYAHIDFPGSSRLSAHDAMSFITQPDASTIHV